MASVVYIEKASLLLWTHCASKSLYFVYEHKWIPTDAQVRRAELQLKTFTFAMG